MFTQVTEPFFSGLPDRYRPPRAVRSFERKKCEAVAETGVRLLTACGTIPPKQIIVADMALVSVRGAKNDISYQHLRVVTFRRHVGMSANKT